MSSLIDSNWFYLNTMQTLSQPRQIASSQKNGQTQTALFSTMLNSVMSSDSTANWVSLASNQVQKNSPIYWSTLGPEVPTLSPLEQVTSSSNGRTPLSFQAISLLDMESKLSGKLSGTAKDFIAAGKKYDLNPKFLASIAQHETGNGTSRAIHEKNNVAGMMGPNGLRTYSTLQESIEAMASNLRRNYLNQGLTTISQIGAKYAPVGASNDPTGLNNYWVTGVTKKMANFI